MKVKDLIAKLQENYKETEDICVIWWDKFSSADERLSDEDWAKVCQEFDEWDEAGADINDWIAEAIINNNTTDWDE
jgi:hypothetical protein